MFDLWTYMPLDGGKLCQHFLEANYCTECGSLLGYGEMDSNGTYTHIIKTASSLEDLAVELACERIKEEQIEELKKAAEEFKEALQGGDLTEYAEADVKFHDVIYHATENQKLVQLLYNLREQMYRYRVEYLKRSEVHQTLLAEHHHIIDCIEKHDKEAAKMAIRTHIDNQFEKVANTIREKK
jgi:DNA-binding GntR family transcriptional regulator